MLQFYFCKYFMQPIKVGFGTPFCSEQVSDFAWMEIVWSNTCSCVCLCVLAYLNERLVWGMSRCTHILSFLLWRTSLLIHFVFCFWMTGKGASRGRSAIKQPVFKHDSLWVFFCACKILKRNSYFYHIALNFSPSLHPLPIANIVKPL